MRISTWIAAATTLFASCGGTVTRAGSARGVLIIAVEALRADHVSCYGYDRATTPELDALARDGVRFEQAFSPAPWVLPATVALLSGCDPLIARRVLPADVPPTIPTLWHVPKEAPHLAQELLRNGYDTAAFLDSALLGPSFGFARGFQEFQGPSMDRPVVADEQGTPGVFERFRHWLDEREPDANWFAFVQLSALDRTWSEHDAAAERFFEPRAELERVPPIADAGHTYFAVARHRWPGGMFTLGEYEAKYDGALHKLDGALGRLLRDLRASGHYDDTTIVFVATNGIGFGESGLYLESGMLTDVDLHVPFVIKPAGRVECLRGSATRPLASLLDLAPTILALEGIPAPSDMQGVSLAPALHDDQPDLRRFLFAGQGCQYGASVIGQRWCFESTEPWRSDDGGLVYSWYGGEPPANPLPREVLHDRANDASVGHAQSAPFDAELIATMRAAAQRWNADVERLRRRLSPAEWNAAPSSAPEAPVR